MPIPQLGHFIATLKKSGAYQNAILIIVGDHGEGLGEHGEDTHGLFLYDSTLHVPLIVKLPGDSHRSEVIDKLVRTTDILPTVLSLTNTPAPRELNGASLVPLIDSQTDPARELLGETDYPLRWGWAPIKALRERNAKLIEAPRPEFYDLQTDPHELKNLYSKAANSQPSPARGTQAELQAEMEKWKAKLPPAPAGAPQTANLPDPKDKVEVQNLLHNSMLASDDGRTRRLAQVSREGGPDRSHLRDRTASTRGIRTSGPGLSQSRRAPEASHRTAARRLDRRLRGWASPGKNR